MSVVEEREGFDGIHNVDNGESEAGRVVYLNALHRVQRTMRLLIWPHTRLIVT